MTSPILPPPSFSLMSFPSHSRWTRVILPCPWGRPLLSNLSPTRPCRKKYHVPHPALLFFFFHSSPTPPERKIVSMPRGPFSGFFMPGWRTARIGRSPQTRSLIPSSVPLVFLPYQVPLCLFSALLATSRKNPSFSFPLTVGEVFPLLGYFRIPVPVLFFVHRDSSPMKGPSYRVRPDLFPPPLSPPGSMKPLRGAKGGPPLMTGEGFTLLRFGLLSQHVSFFFSILSLLPGRRPQWSTRAGSATIISGPSTRTDHQFFFVFSSPHQAEFPTQWCGPNREDQARIPADSFMGFLPPPC